MRYVVITQCQNRNEWISVTQLESGVDSGVATPANCVSPLFPVARAVQVARRQPHVACVPGMGIRTLQDDWTRNNEFREEGGTQLYPEVINFLPPT